MRVFISVYKEGEKEIFRHIPLRVKAEDDLENIVDEFNIFVHDTFEEIQDEEEGEE